MKMLHDSDNIDAMAMTTAMLAGAPVQFKPMKKRAKGAAQAKKDKRRQAKASRAKNRKR